MANFKSKVVAKIKGDEADVLATRIEARAKAALDGQGAALAAKKVEANIRLEDAKVALENAKYPSTDISTSSYIQGIRNAQDIVDDAQEAVDEIDASITYYLEVKEELFG